MTMQSIGRSANEVRAALQAYRDEIEEILQMIPSGTFLVRGAGEQARAAAQRLKAGVKADYKMPAHLKRRMSDVERKFLEPCMHRVFAHLQNLTTNSNPGPDWRHALDEADADLGHWLALLNQEA